jgi:preprotein translocase subunit SecG
MGTRQAGNLLTKLSWWCGGIFLGLAFVLQLMSARAAVPTSVLDRMSAPAPTSAPVAPSGAAPALPLETPATPSPEPATAPAPTPNN